jgi:hypothetical protein
MLNLSFFLATFLVLVPTQTPTFRPALPLNQGHSHNDYWRPHPLYDALQLGFKSVEADVFLIDNTLQVGHEPAALRRANTLQSLYLDPLRQLQQTQGGFYTQPGELWLFVDFKNDGPATYARLRQVLARYRDLLSTPSHPRPTGVRVILTGGYPRAEVLADPEALVFLDGQLADLGAAQAASICTVNGDWATCFKWNGLGPMPAAEAARLRAWNDEAQRTGQKIRFWNTPAATPTQRRAVWAALLRYPAVLVGADELAELKQVIDAQAKS